MGRNSVNILQIETKLGRAAALFQISKFFFLKYEPDLSCAFTPTLLTITLLLYYCFNPVMTKLKIFWSQFSFMKDFLFKF